MVQLGHQSRGIMGSLTHVFSVAMRQRHTPSLVLLFLCLKPPSILSHTYCRTHTNQHVRFIVVVPVMTYCRNTSNLQMICVYNVHKRPSQFLRGEAA